MKEIQKITERINQVKNHGWQTLDLRNCGLNEIPIEVFSFTDLITLDFGNDTYCDPEKRNKITIVPDDISKLRKLARLNLQNNEVTEVSDKLSAITTLNYLNLSGNKLRDLSDKIANMTCLKQLYLDENPFDMLPPEIVARGIESVRNFYRELEEKDYLYEVKLIVVGEGRVGKTCITSALVNDQFKLNDSPSTEGININTWIIPQQEIAEVNAAIQRDFQINIWDFGGQEIYHSTHQFFLTKRSIYLLVTESRKEDSHDDFFYWLNIIKLLGDRSPVIMVLNKCDQPTKELPLKEYRETFNNIIDFQKISLREGYEDTFSKFKSVLKKTASNLPHIGNPLPKVWVDIRREIETLKVSGRNYISQLEYLEICKKHYRNEESALFLSEYFHDLGVLLHFKDDFELKDIVILNHEWITSGVYKILDDRIVIQNKGHFNNADLNRIWSDDEHSGRMRELISLMKNRKFDLCFEIRDGEYLVPRLLPVDEIDHKWTTSNTNLKFELRYKFMPKGILARLIVKLSSDILEDKYWRYGVVLRYENTKAIIRERYFENKITIELEGTNKREFLFTIRKAIQEINKDFNKIKVSEMVPCKCSHCLNVESPQFYDFDLLKRYEAKGLTTIRCEQSLEEVKVLELTSDISKQHLSSDKLVICENKNADLLKVLNIDNVLFYGDKDSSSVFIQVKTRSDRFGLRDRDFLLDSEVDKLRKKYPNYFILDYYCFENYLFTQTILQN